MKKLKKILKFFFISLMVLMAIAFAASLPVSLQGPDRGLRKK
jgi:hypothetical protein